MSYPTPTGLNLTEWSSVAILTDPTLTHGLTSLDGSGQLMPICSGVARNGYHQTVIIDHILSVPNRLHHGYAEFFWYTKGMHHGGIQFPTL